MQSTENGVISSAAGADTVNGSRNLTATGLLGHNTTRTWNGTGSVTISRTVGITFNGTEFVPMTVGSQNCTLDLATGKPTKNQMGGARGELPSGLL